MIARFIAREHEQLHAYVPRSAAQCRLAQLLKRRGKLRGAAGQLAAGLARGGGGAGRTGGGRRGLCALAGARGPAGGQALEALPETRTRARQVRTIPGYGALGSVALAHALTRLPFTNVDAFIAHIGLDPRPQDSGNKHGRRRLSKRGPAELRRMLHICAMSATRSKAWQPYDPSATRQGLEWYGRGGGPGA